MEDVGDVLSFLVAGPTNSLAFAFVAPAAGRLPYTPTAVRAPGVFLVLPGALCVLLKGPLTFQPLGGALVASSMYFPWPFLLFLLVRGLLLNLFFDLNVRACFEFCGGGGGTNKR